MGDVTEFIIDGTSGLVPEGVDGKAIVAGVCSKGEVGKAYIIGKRSNLSTMLGTGPLVDAVRDIIATAGQEPILVAVPVKGRPGSYISPVSVSLSQVKVSVYGVAQQNADVIINVSTPGEIGTAIFDLSLDGGATFTKVESAAALTLAKTGATLCFPEDALFEEGASYRVTIRTEVGNVEQISTTTSPMLEIVADKKGILDSASLVVQIVKAGKRNEGTYQYSIDGGQYFTKSRTIPFDGVVSVDGYGALITFPEGEYEGGASYSCALLAPVPSITDVMTALESPLSSYDVEFVHIACPTSSVDWAAVGAKAEELWSLHRPTYFKMEARLPYAGEDLNDYTTAMLKERENFSAKFVQVCVQFGEISEASGERRMRNLCGLQSGRVMSIPVQRATGRVKDGSIVQASLPSGWDAVQPLLEEAGFITAKKYAGLSGSYWGDSPTLAEKTSDYRYEEVLRTVFKAIRKERIAALKSMYDEGGDPLAPDNSIGDAYLVSQIETALDTMVKAMPQELAGYNVVIPPNQDKVNNATVVETTLIGIPIIRNIKLFSSYVYAGGNFDPRMEYVN